jgi:hypothetical protein
MGKMKIKRFNESSLSKEYLSLDEIRDLFLYWIEESDTELYLTILEWCYDGQLIDDDVYIKTNETESEVINLKEKNISCFNIIIPESIHKVNMKDLDYNNFGKLSTFLCKMMESVQLDLKKYGLKITINRLPNLEGDVEL